MERKKTGKAAYMISAVAQTYGIHPQTLRLYEREGLLKPSRSEGNTRLYTQEDLERLSVILNLTRDLGVNLAGVEIIMDLRRRIETMQEEMDRFIAQVRDHLGKRAQEGAIESSRALVRVAGPGRSFKAEKR